MDSRGVGGIAGARNIVFLDLLNINRQHIATDWQWMGQWQVVGLWGVRVLPEQTVGRLAQVCGGFARIWVKGRCAQIRCLKPSFSIANCRSFRYATGQYSNSVVTKITLWQVRCATLRRISGDE